MAAETTPLTELLERLQREFVVALDGPELQALLDASEEECQVQTSLAGPIRVLRLGERRLLQEQTTEGAPLVRLLRAEYEAEALIKDRLDSYERMWDG